MKLPDLKSLISGGVSESVKKISDVAHSWITTGKDRREFDLDIEKLANEQANKIAEQAQTEVDSYLKDAQSARDSYTRIEESENASKLEKNIRAIMILVITVGFFGLLGYMLKFEIPKSNERIMDIMLGSLGTAWITTIGFYFGSSQGSKETGKRLHDIYKGK